MEVVLSVFKRRNHKFPLSIDGPEMGVRGIRDIRPFGRTQKTAWGKTFQGTIYI